MLSGYGIVVGIGIGISFLVGFATLFLIHGEAENFFIAGRSLPLWIVGVTLGAQCIDSNAILGNADLSYQFSFYDGAVLPLGLGLSLILNGLFLASHINAERNILTLPDVLAKRYGKIVEVLVSMASIVSFMMLLAGNLVGMGSVLAYVYGMTVQSGIWFGFAVVWAYTVTGGLFSVAYTDVIQGILGWSGSIVFVYYMIATADYRAPPPSIGFPSYIYPDLQGEGGVCDMYSGVACTINSTLCCYNEDLWCPSVDNCTTDNGAYPIGDKPVYSNQLFYFNSLSVCMILFVLMIVQMRTRHFSTWLSLTDFLFVLVIFCTAFSECHPMELGNHIDTWDWKSSSTRFSSALYGRKNSACCEVWLLVWWNVSVFCRCPICLHGGHHSVR